MSDIEIEVQDLPIAVRKGIRTCTHCHTLCLMTNYLVITRSFLGHLNSATIPKTVEVVTLKMNKTWELMDLPKGKTLVDVIGYSLLNTRQMGHRKV